MLGPSFETPRDARLLRMRPENGCALKKTSLQFPSFADLVVLARGLNPFPYRTRPLNPSAPMVLSLKAWKSRSLPGLPRTEILSLHDDRLRKARRRETDGGLSLVDAAPAGDHTPRRLRRTAKPLSSAPPRRYAVQPTVVAAARPVRWQRGGAPCRRRSSSRFASAR